MPPRKSWANRKGYLNGTDRMCQVAITVKNSFQQDSLRTMARSSLFKGYRGFRWVVTKDMPTSEGYKAHN